MAEFQTKRDNTVLFKSKDSKNRNFKQNSIPYSY